MDETYAGLLHSARTEDPSVFLILKDYLEEKGESMILDVGERYLIYTLTFYYTGEVIESTPGRTVLKNAGIVYDVGDLETALSKGKLVKFEPAPNDVTLKLNTSHISCGWTWNHPLPRKRIQ